MRATEARVSVALFVFSPPTISVSLFPPPLLPPPPQKTNAKKLSRLLSEFSDVRVVATDPARRFFSEDELPLQARPVRGDEDEWRAWRRVGDPVLHIELRRWADVGVVAPASANSLAKFANVRVWRFGWSFFGGEERGGEEKREKPPLPLFEKKPRQITNKKTNNENNHTNQNRASATTSSPRSSAPGTGTPSRCCSRRR